MASRRFKFKPKPVISSVARKPKEISDISGHVDKDDSVEPIKSNSNSFGTQFIAESIEKESPGIANEFQITLKNGLAVESHSKTVECNLNIKHNINEFEEEIKENTVSVVPNDISAAEHEKVEGIGNSELEQDDYNFQKNTETDSSLSNTESEKCNQEKPKVATKFGRFRCKPVLSGATPRRKAEEPNQGNTVDIIHSKPVDNCEPVEKVEQCESDVNDVVLLLEPQKVNLTSTDQSICDILDKETPNSSKTVIVELSKPPLSPVKTSHKTFALKPIPRLSDRRPSLQAIESEEDSNQNKDTADDLKQHKDLLDEEKQIIPKKEQSLSKNKRQPRSQLSTFARMGQDALDKLKDKFGDQSPVKNEMTMLDLIFYNPKSNPMSQKPISVTNSKRKLDLDTKDSSGLVDDILAEQSIDDVEELSNHTMPVPQLKVGPDGQVILDPQSLIIETTDVKKNRENLENSEVVQETEGSYKSYLKKRSKRNEWSPEETLQFYRALNTLGTDFALMASLFPKRTRRDLKLKFKREERVNLHLVDKAVTQPMEFDFKVLEEEMKQDADLIATRAAEKEKLKKEMKEEKEKLKKLKETVIGKKKYRYKSEVFKQFLDEDIGEFRTSKSVKRKKAKRIKVKNIKELINNEHFEDKDRVKRIPKETKLGKIPKRSRSANPVETEVIKPKEGKLKI